MSVQLRERKKQQQREAIVQAAVALFRERGFEGTRIQDVLERAEISLGTFYNYFAGKDAVLDEFGAEVIGSYMELARHELEARDQPVPARVRALARACGRAFSADPDFMTVVVTNARAFGGRGPLPATEVPIYALLCVLFEEGQARGEVRDDIPPIELAETFSGTFMFAVVSWLMNDERQGLDAGGAEAQLDARLARAFEVFFEGCGGARRER